MSGRSTSEIQDDRARQYPRARGSAVLPALRLAQERVRLALAARRSARSPTRSTLTPAYCKSVASFYDMFHLEPVGEHLIEVCTNVSCALVGAQQVLEAFEHELGVRAGETTEDGERHAAHGRVPRRLRLGDGRRGRRPLPRSSVKPGDVAGDRRGAAAVAEPEPSEIVLAGADEQRPDEARRVPRRSAATRRSRRRAR